MFCFRERQEHLEMSMEKNTVEAGEKVQVTEEITGGFKNAEKVGKDSGIQSTGERRDWDGRTDSP